MILFGTQSSQRNSARSKICCVYSQCNAYNVVECRFSVGSLRFPVFHLITPLNFNEANRTDFRLILISKEKLYTDERRHNRMKHSSIQYLNQWLQSNRIEIRLIVLMNVFNFDRLLVIGFIQRANSLDARLVNDHE